MLLDLDRHEFDVVADVLRRAMGELREEIYKCEVAEYEAELKAREVTLGRVISKLDAAAASGLAEGEPASRR